MIRIGTKFVLRYAFFACRMIFEVFDVNNGVGDGDERMLMSAGEKSVEGERFPLWPPSHDWSKSSIVPLCSPHLISSALKSHLISYFSITLISAFRGVSLPLPRPLCLAHLMVRRDNKTSLSSSNRSRVIRSRSPQTSYILRLKQHPSW